MNLLPVREASSGILFCLFWARFVFMQKLKLVAPPQMATCHWKLLEKERSSFQKYALVQV